MSYNLHYVILNLLNSLSCWKQFCLVHGKRRHLRSTNRNILAVPRHRLNTYGGRAFAVAGPTVWNSLPDFTRDPSISTDSFRRLLKTYILRDTSACSALEVDNFMRYINLLTYLLTSEIAAHAFVTVSSLACIKWLFIITIIIIIIAINSRPQDYTNSNW